MADYAPSAPPLHGLRLPAALCRRLVEDERYLRYLPVVFIAYCALRSILLGQDANWDLRNYHYYDAFAFLHNRMDYDIAPAQLQSYFNPILPLFFYLLVNHLPPIVVGGLLGAWQGVNLVLVYLLSRRWFADFPRPARNLIALFAGLAGAVTPMFTAGLGASFGDGITSLLVLASLLLATGGGGASWARTLLAGLLIGTATGVKLVNAPYALGLLAFLAVAASSLSGALIRCMLAGLGALAGVLACTGFWCATLYARFGNPLFPFYNHIFKSPFGIVFDLSDKRFLPQSFRDGLLYPFQWATGRHPTAEIPFRDLRWAIIAVLVICAAIAVLISRSPAASAPTASRRLRRGLLAFAAVSYLVWLRVFAIHRYLLPLDLLAGVLMAVLAGHLCRARFRRWVAPLTALLCTLAMLSGRGDHWGRVPFGSTWFGVELPRLDESPALVLQPDWAPTAYVVPFFPPSTRFVRVGGNFQHFITGTRLEQLQRTTIAAHGRGAVYALTEAALDAGATAALERYGYRPTGEPPLLIRSRIGPPLQLQRLAPSAP